MLYNYRFHYFIFLLAISGIFQAAVANTTDPTLQVKASQWQEQRSRQVLFEENKGQVKDQHWQPRPDVKYYGQSEGMGFFIRDNGISYQLYKIDSWKEEDKRSFETGREKHQVPDQITIYRVDIHWLGAQTPSIVRYGEQPEYNNYYNVPEGVEPALFVKQYEKVVLKNLWPGIDMEYYSRNGHLESDWIVHQAEDYKQIAFEVKGAELSIEDGKLIMKTPLGEIAEGALKVYQNNRELRSYWKLEGNIVRVEIENFIPEKPLRIDPPVRMWGTYYGGFPHDEGTATCVDGNGNVYLAGYSLSDVNISTIGAHQTIFGGTMDAFLVKFDNNGVRLWGTYYGGSNDDYAKSCTVDLNGDVYMAGSTSSNTHISAFGAHQVVYGGSKDAFLVKFDSYGARLWGTYYGGSAEDEGNSCVVDGIGNVFLAGYTYSTNAIASVGAHQSSFVGGWEDAFLVKFSGNGVRLWGTYYGGSDVDRSFSCAVDGNGNVFLAGHTKSTNAIATAGTHQTIKRGNNDAFLVKFNSNGVRLWGTYFGGLGDEFENYCATDVNGNIYMTGTTTSAGFIATPGAHQTTYAAGSSGAPYDAFLVKFNNNGVRQWGTYYGSNGIDRGLFCTTDNDGNVYLTGSTTSSSAISTPGAHQSLIAGEIDAFIVKFDTNGVRQWGTYYGGSQSDYGLSCVVDRNRYLYLTGNTNSYNNIITIGAHQLIKFHNNSIAGFLAKFCVGFPIVSLTSSPATDSQTVCINQPITSIIYSTLHVMDATFFGLPDGLKGNFIGNNAVISGAPTQPGTFNYVVTLLGYCDTVYVHGVITVDNTNITLISAPGSDNQTVSVNSPIVNIIYSTTSATGAIFSGLPPGVHGSFTSGLAVISGTPTEEGTFDYTVTLSGGCDSVSANGTIKVEKYVGVNEHSQSKWSIFPNPSNGTFTIQTDKGGLFELLDLTGKVLKTYQVPTNTYTISEKLPAGVYLLREKRGNTVQKVVIE